MTSDAKIGLLLGLVFIFVIAFVINGLPSFRDATNNSELTTNMVNSPRDSWGLGTNERKVQEGFDWTGQPIERPVEEEVPPPVEEQREDIRFIMPIPDDIAIVDETSIEITPELIEQTLAQSADLIVPELNVDDPIAIEPVARKVVEPSPAEEGPRTRKRRPATRVMPKVYVVSDGDTLASIAKKFYGSEEGNKHANIVRIFEANRKSLKSIDQVVAGHKILVPPLRAPKSAQKKTESTLASSFFEEAKSIGRRLLSGDKPKPKAKPGTQYVVQDGDYLWRVAARQLGDATRYKEIVKLNPGVLKNENATLKIGMQLNLPAQ
ncbi:MAG: LysM peptidoglycan-binding domain-containing protein [Planctomycetota bacterium]|nr:LysM peptidoglycan-binding domain-containing protein [Planctomycetota bacterium]